MSISLKKIATILLNSQSLTIVLHQNPDGDVIGSANALTLSLNSQVTISSSTKIADIFKKIIPNIKTVNKLGSKSDTYVILDCSETHRTGFTKELAAIPLEKIVIIDHHQKNGDLVKNYPNNFVDKSCSATAEIIDELLKEMHVAVTPEIATSLLLGIFTDTGGFKHPNTSVNTLSRASKLIRYGGDLQKIKKIFLKKLSISQRKLWGSALSGLYINKWGIAVTKITKNSLKETSSLQEDIFGLANIIALTTEAKASLVLIEQDNGWRGILRTRHKHIDISRLAKLLGGKGQKKAAGFTATKRLFSSKIDN